MNRAEMHIKRKQIKDMVLTLSHVTDSLEKVPKDIRIKLLTKQIELEHLEQYLNAVSSADSESGPDESQLTLPLTYDNQE